MLFRSSYVGDVLDLAAACDIVNKSGAWYNYEGNRVGQGRENSKQFLLDHPDILAEIDRKVREHYNLDPDGARTAEPEPVGDAGAGAAGAPADKPVE